MTSDLDAFIARFAERPAAVALESLCAIEARGADAEAFLQSQFSNDVVAGVGACQLNAYCNPKGRVIALIRLLRRADGFWLIVPAALSEPLLARLRMYILRAQVELAPRPQIALHGLIGIDDHDLDAADADIESASVAGIIPRRIMIADRAAADSWLRARDLVPHRDHPPVHPDADADAAWRLLDILSGIPQVHAPTAEQFIPQTINLDWVDAISFTKGCYPGQEIIARLRHRGKVKQRLLAAVADMPAAPAPGDPLYASDHPDQKAGMIVDAVRIGEQRYTFSAIAGVDASERDALRALPSGATQPARRIPLPYSI